MQSNKPARRTTRTTAAWTRSFAGCWTCRSRHVKCDEARPECSKCVKAGRDCLGYAPGVSWQQGAVQKNAGRMRMLPSHSSAVSRLSASQVRQALGALESAAAGTTVHEGPFSVFPLDGSPTAPCSPLAQDIEADANVENNASPVPESARAQSLDAMCAQTVAAGDRDSLPAHGSPGDTNPGTLDLIELQDGGFGNAASPPPRDEAPVDGGQAPNLSEAAVQNDSTDQYDTTGIQFLSPGFSLNPEWLDSLPFFEEFREGEDAMTIADTHTEQQNSNPDFIMAGTNSQDQTYNEDYELNIISAAPPQLAPRVQGRHLDLLPVPSRQSRLVHHWITSLCHRMTAVPTLNNPFLNSFTQPALEGCQLASNKSDGRVALFHSICAAAAFHLHALSGDINDLQSATKHHALGITHLRLSIGEREPAQRSSILASLFMCALQESIIGQPGIWRTHFSTYQHRSDGNAPPHSRDALDIKLAVAMSETFRQSHTQGPTNNVDLLHVSGLSDEEDAGFLTTIYGISLSTLRNIIKIRQMVSEPASFSTEDVDRFDIELHLSIPSYPTLTQLSSAERGHLTNHGMAFYFSVLIYFRRAIRHTPVKELQSFVELGLRHVEALDITSDPANPVVWPVLTIFMAAEGDRFRPRIDKWLRKRGPLGLKVWDRVSEIVHDAWYLRSGRQSDAQQIWHGELQVLSSKDVSLL
jgi:hypothetical protein